MITSAIPKLPFIDKQQTVDYYVNQLGFALRSDYGDYIIVSLEGAEMHFFSYPDLVPGKSDFMIYLRIDKEIDSMYRRFQEKGIAIHPNGKLEDKPWGQREFAVIDPNGTLLTFGQAIG
ncbi:MAG TPA: VOC family protein [Cyclobacteriaceae bacterium]|jgi:uncharacterized glyoxalase superfamily protein PhnB